MPIKRFAFNVLSTLSLLLFLLTVLLWIRSYWVVDHPWSEQIVLGSRPYTLSRWMQSSRGGLLLQSTYQEAKANEQLKDSWSSRGWARYAPTRYPRCFSVWTTDDALVPEHYRAKFLGFTVMWPKNPNRFDEHITAIIIPMPFLAFCFGLLPFRALHPLRLLRARRGRCPHCGYDLRATPDRCPECGHVR